MTHAAATIAEPQTSEQPESAQNDQTSKLHSCLYEGFVHHHRYAPVPHEFRNRLCMMLIDLDEVDTVFGRSLLYSKRFLAPVRYCREDYLGDPDRPLDECVRDLVHQKTGLTANGPIRLLTHVRHFGFVFNPLSVYYCFDPTDSFVMAIVAEVTNTPWGEKYCYVVTNDGKGNVIHHDCRKDFHVSPFLPMDIDYNWRITQPDINTSVRLQLYSQSGHVFDATLVLKRRELTPFNRLRSIIRFPAMTAQVVTAIYWQAFRLWLKKTPFIPHPNTGTHQGNG